MDDMGRPMKVGDLIVHIGAKPGGYRIRLACMFERKYKVPALSGFKLEEIVIFEDGQWDWKDSWKPFKGWNYEKP